jgi:hypothetical protein
MTQITTNSKPETLSTTIKAIHASTSYNYDFKDINTIRLEL